jgi:hypothetical protein
VSVLIAYSNKLFVSARRHIPVSRPLDVADVNVQFLSPKNFLIYAAADARVEKRRRFSADVFARSCAMKFPLFTSEAASADNTRWFGSV